MYCHLQRSRLNLVYISNVAFQMSTSVWPMKLNHFKDTTVIIIKHTIVATSLSYVICDMCLIFNNVFTISWFKFAWFKFSYKITNCTPFWIVIACRSKVYSCVHGKNSFLASPKDGLFTCRSRSSIYGIQWVFYFGTDPLSDRFMVYHCTVSNYCMCAYNL